MNFFNLFKRKIQVNLTKTEYEQETENLKKYFQVSLEIIKQEVQNIFVITEEKEVAVAEVEAEEKANFFTIQEIDEVEKQLQIQKEFEDEISKLPTFLELDKMYPNLYYLYKDRSDFIDTYGKENKEIIHEFDKEIAELESKRKELESKLEEEKKELWDRKFSDSAKGKISNIKSIKDFTVKGVAEAKKTDPFDEKDIASIFKK